MAAAALMARNAGLSIVVAGVHTTAMIASRGAIALVVHKWLGLKFLSRVWFDLDVVWALSLVLVGAIGLVTAVW